MDPSLLSRLKEELLVCEALSPAECEARLAELGRGSPELERELRSLLRQRSLFGDEPSAVGRLMGTLLPELPDANAPILRSLGPYRLLEVLGVGGMAIVYRAEQQEPLRREVAVKLLRGGLDPARVMARFTAEQRAMALVEHPAIARILDAGLDVDGMPYLVAELVRGVPISEYCAERRLAVPEVLRLFIELCRAVQHAHQKSIIHRDLKPSNILVAEVDGSPRPKVIDFGIARILEEEFEAGPALTAEGQVVGTLGYMSPEQAAGRSRAIDTRTDVYSLGVVLYELLTGALPHPLEGLSASEALAALAREAPRPFRLRSERRPTRDGELETVVLKALAREPEARYEGAGALADDLERYLRHEAILARPPSAVYLLRKLVRRHRTPFAAGAAAIVLVVVAAVAMAVLYAGQRRERERAEVEASRTEAMNQFLLGMLRAPSPGVLGRAVTVREVLDRSIPTVDRSFAREPLVRAAVTTTLGTTYREMGHYAIADSLLRRGLELERREHGPRHADVARALRELADNSLRWRHTREADSLGRLALAMSEELSGPGGPDVASCLLVLADVQTKLGRGAEAESLATRYLELARSLYGEESAEFGRGMFQLAQARMISGRGPGAYYQSAAGIFTRTLGADHTETLDALSGYADCLIGQGRAREAVDVERDVLARTRKTHGDSHPNVGDAMHLLARGLVHFGSYAEAESLERDALNIWSAALGEENPHMPAGFSVMGEIRFGRGDLVGAEVWTRRALTLSLRIHSEEHPRSVGEMHVLARILASRGKRAEADSLYRRIVTIRRRAYGLADPVTVQAFTEYGMFLMEEGRVDSAAALFATAISHVDPQSPEHAVLAAALRRIDAHHESKGRSNPDAKPRGVAAR